MRTLLLLAMILLVGAGCRGPGKSLFATPPPLQTDAWEVRFEGGKTLPLAELRDVITESLVEFQDEGISKPGIDDAAYELEVHYRARGFPDAYIDYDYGATTPVQATILIEEGPRVVLDEIRLDGHSSFPTAELLAFFPARSDGLFGSEPRYYVRTRVASAISALRTFYRQSGFLEAQVSDPVVTRDATGTRADVAVTIVEGPRFTLAAADVTFRGEVGVTGERLAALQRLPREYLQPEGAPPSPYTRRLAHALRAHVLAQYGSWGYPDCNIEVSPEVNTRTGHVTLALDVEAGVPVRIARIEIVGNDKTRNGFIRNRLGIEAGHDYDADAIREGFGKLYTTGLFETVSIDLEESAARERTLVVTVDEAPSIELFVEPGYGSYEGPRLSFGAEERNLFGTGRSLRVESTVGPLAQHAKLGFVDRAFLRTDVQASATVFVNHREEPSFTITERGAGVELRHPWPRQRLLATVGYQFRTTDVSDVEIVDPIAQELLEDVDISSISASLTRDTRDHPLIPSHGNRARVNLELASKVLGSEIDFLAARVEDAQFFALPWRGGVLGLSGRTGVIEPIADTEVIPLQQRYFNGGENTVRSFREDELGPLDSTGEPLGGEAYSVFTAELRQDFFSRFSGALFFDAGNVSPTVEEWSSFDHMRTAIGVGVRYMLPIGPLRVDAGFNPNARDNEDDYVIHFSVGMSF